MIAIPTSHWVPKETTVLLSDHEYTYSQLVRVNAVHLFEKQADSNWQQIQLIDAEDFPGYASLGIGATFSGEQLILPAIREDNGNGDLLVLERRVSGLEITEVIQPLPGEIYRGYNDSFVFQDDHALVRLTSAEGLGVVGVYEKSEHDEWRRVATLTSGIDSTFDEFGAQLVLDGELAIVAGFDANRSNEDGESIYENPYVMVFGRSESGTWRQIDRLTEPPSFVDYNNPGRFGWSIAAVDGVVYVGTGVNIAGAIYVFAPAPEPTSANLLTCMLGLVGPFSRSPRRR